MPRVTRTILPRIRKSLEERGIAVTLARSVLLPWHLVKDFRMARGLQRVRVVSEFDREHGVNTEGEFDGWTHLSDLEIASPNWIHGNNYAAVEPERFYGVMAALPIHFEDFTFVDFGSGKGRALLLASEYPFKKIVGLEFSRELHDAAVENVRGYRSATQRCREIEPLVMDFVDYKLPTDPLVLFFFDPCDEKLLEPVMANLEESVKEHSRPLFVAYVGPRGMELEKMASRLKPVFRDTARQIATYVVR